MYGLKFVDYGFTNLRYPRKLSPQSDDSTVFGNAIKILTYMIMSKVMLCTLCGGVLIDVCGLLTRDFHHATALYT